MCNDELDAQADDTRRRAYKTTALTSTYRKLIEADM